MAAASNLAIRLATAAVGVPVILYLVFLGPPWGFYVLTFATTIVGAMELFAMSHPGDRVSQVVGVLVSAAVSLALFFFTGDPRVLLTVLFVVPAFGPLFTLVRLGTIESAALRVFAMGFGPIFLAVPLAMLGLMRYGFRGHGSGFVLLSLGLSWFADTGAYFAGRFFGRRKLYEAVSPKKTLEGAIGGLVAAVAFALFGSFVYLRGALPVSHALVLALVGGPLGMAGDLGESLLKRSTGVKDSGGIVPGHGGMLDRVDALLVTSGIVYLYGLWLY